MLTISSSESTAFVGEANSIALTRPRHLLNQESSAALPTVYPFAAGLIPGESVGVSGCPSDYGIVAHGPPSDPSLRVSWVGNGERAFDFIGRTMCEQKTSGAKYAELLRQGQQLLPSPPSTPPKFKLR